MWSEHEFPLSTFLELKYYLEHKKEFPIAHKIVGYSETSKSDFEMELDYLSNKK
jgi:hypothetical protein